MKTTSISKIHASGFSILLALLLVAFATTASIARATLIATDDFESYTADATLVGGNGGTGWSAAWSGSSAHATVVSGSNAITYTLDNGQVRGGGNALKITAPNTDEIQGILERAVPEITGGGDVFVSLVFKIKSAAADGSTFADNNGVYYLAGDGAKDSARDASVYAGYAGKVGARLAAGRLSIDGSIVTGQTYFLVIRYSGWNSGVQAYDTISAWLNPDTTDEWLAPTSGNNTSNDRAKAITREGNSAGYGSTKFSSLYLNTHGLDSTTRFHVIDDIRIGRTWADVVGIPMPVVDTVNPTEVRPNDVVTIAGRNLADATVTVAGDPIVPTSQTETSLQFTVPASLGKGEHDVVITGPGGSLAKTITVVTSPVINSITPDNGVPGETVVIAGQNLEGVAVTMGGLPVEIVSNTGTELAIKIPVGLATGSHTITIANSAGDSDTTTFTNNAPTPPPPEAGGVNLPFYRAGGTVTLSGANLAGATSVTVGGIAVEIISRADGSLVFKLPDDLVPGRYVVVITTAGGVSATMEIVIGTLIAVDGFDDYTAGSTLIDANQGIGWTSAWHGTNNNYVTVVDEEITYTLDNGQVRGGGKALKISGPAEQVRTTDVLERDIPMVSDGRDVYMSFVFKVKSDVPEGETFTNHNLVCWYAKDGSKHENQDLAGYVGYTGKLAARLAGGTPPGVTTPLIVGQTYFAVVRYGAWFEGKFRAYDGCRVWLNPTTNDKYTEDPAITAYRKGDTSGYGNTDIRGIYLMIEGLNDTSRFHIVDDIRIGETWEDVVGVPMPVVNNIEPATATPGHMLTLTGKNLADVTVTIGGEPAVITAQNATSAQLTVPDSLSKGPKEMLVTGAGGTLSKTLVIVFPPEIASVTPSSGGTGDTLVVSGNNLEETVTTIGGLPAEFQWNAEGTQLSVVIPEGLAKGDATITVTNVADSATIGFTVTSETPPPPVISGVNSPFCRDGATVVFFGADLAGATSVTVGGVSTTIVSRSNRALSFVIPAGLGRGDHAIVITTASGEVTGSIKITDLIAVDNFNDYGTGSLPANVAYTSGWSGGWSGNPGISITDSPDDAVSYTLTDGTILGGGKALKLALDTSVEGLFNRVLERNIVHPVNTGEDVFVSFVFKIKSPAKSAGSPLSTMDSISSTWYPKDELPDASRDTLAYIGYKGKVSANLAGPASAAFVSPQLNADQSYFVVIRYGGWDAKRQAYMKCRVWLNPPTNDEGATRNDITNERVATAANFGSSSFLGLCVDTMGITSAGRYQVIDDIRVGYTWAAVTGSRLDFIASDNFDSYKPNSKLANANGGEGWDTPWAGNAWASITNNPADIVSYVLEDGSVRGGGYALKIAGSTVDPNALALEVLQRRFSTVPKGDDVYASFVFKIKSPDVADGSPLTGVNAARWHAADGARDPENDTAAYVGINGHAGGKVSNTLHGVNNTLIAGKPYFIVVRYGGWNPSQNRYKTCRVWLNPASADKDSTDPAIVVEANDAAAGFGNTHIEGVYVNTLGLTMGGAYHVVDDIRVGSTWESVVGAAPVFEPGAPPQIDALPSTEFAPGDVLTLTGSKFTGLARVMIGGVEAQILGHDDATINVIIPAGCASGDVAVFTNTGYQHGSGALFIASQPVFVTNLQPVQVAVEGRPVDFAVDVWATGSISCQWQWRPAATANWEPISGEVSMGADSNNISLYDPAGRDGWQVRCVATTVAGATESTASTIALTKGQFSAPAGLALGSGKQAGHVYVSDREAHTVSVIASGGEFAVLAGSSGNPGKSDGSGTLALLNQPRGLAFQPDGKLLVADSGNTLLRTITLDTQGVQTHVPTEADAFVYLPAALSVHASSTTSYILDTGNHLLKRLRTDGVVEIVAGSGVSGTDNGALLNARFNSPAGLAIAASGSILYVADTDNHVIRAVNLVTGTVSTYAGQMAAKGAADGDAATTASFERPMGLALHASGDLYVADSGNSRIRVVTTDFASKKRVVVTLAGSGPGFRDGIASKAWFAAPEDIALGGDGMLYVADTGNGIIRRIAPDADAQVSTPVLKAVPFPPAGGGGSGDGKSGGGGGGGSLSLWFLLALAACAAVRGCRNRTNA